MRNIMNVALIFELNHFKIMANVTFIGSFELIKFLL